MKKNRDMTPDTNYLSWQLSEDSGIGKEYITITDKTLESWQKIVDTVAEMIDVYTRRRDLMVAGLREAGLEVEPSRATFYLWVRVPQGWTSTDITSRLLESGVVVTPGNGFGEPGEGYFRITLTQTSWIRVKWRSGRDYPRSARVMPRAEILLRISEG